MQNINNSGQQIKIDCFAQAALRPQIGSDITFTAEYITQSKNGAQPRIRTENHLCLKQVALPISVDGLK